MLSFIVLFTNCSRTGYYYCVCLAPNITKFAEIFMEMASLDTYLGSSTTRLGSFKQCKSRAFS